MSTSPRLIGSGSYGCVYRPPLCRPPNESGTADRVGKLALPSGVVEELNVGAKIRQSIPDWDQYFGLLDPDSCHPNITPEITQECILFKNVKPDRYSEVNSYSSPYLGTTLHSLQQPITMQWLWDTCSHLIRGLAKLHAQKIYHMDIKSTNIVIDDTGTARLIDFGIALINPTAKYLQDERYSYYKMNPLFYNVYSTQRRFGIGSRFYLEADPELLKTYYDDYDYLAKFYNSHYARDTGSDLIRISLYAGSLPRYISTVVIPNLGKVDLFQLGKTFNDYYIRQKNAGQILNYANDPLINPWNTLINGLMHIDVYQQWDLQKTLRYIDSTINEITEITEINEITDLTRSTRLTI